MASSDRVQGVSGSLAIKAPVRVATTAAITLSGLQTIDGVILVADDRVLVKDQGTPTENGIYVASTSTWQRARDFDGAYDSVAGTLVSVNEGTANAEALFRVATSGTPGTDAITFTVAAAVALEANLASAAGAGLVGITDAGTHFAGATVEAALQELGAEDDVLAAAIAVNAGDITADEAALAAHIADTTAAHAASAIAVTPAGNLASTDVQAALVELQGDIDAVGGGVGQTWTAFSIGAGPTATHRAAATLFTNSTGKPIMVNVTVSGTVTTGSMEANLEVGGVIVAGTFDILGSNTHRDTLSALVPNGAQYQLRDVSQAGITRWTELR